ncbi:MAG: hypothetical protein HUJ52_02425 [Malacoplasma sp.]|nr:hypothetical protein [Malacoplasma sp.]
MEKISKKLIKKVWNKYTKCTLYIKAIEKSSMKNVDDELFSNSLFYIEYVKGILRCMKQAEYNVLVAEYINFTGNDHTYTRSGWYAKLKKANNSFFKYFDKKFLKDKRKNDKQ